MPDTFRIIDALQESRLGGAPFLCRSRRSGDAPDIDYIIDAVQKVDPEHGSDAFTLLAVLWHDSNGDMATTLVIEPETMVGVEVVPHWGWKRYADARDVLVKAGLLVNHV